MHCLTSSLSLSHSTSFSHSISSLFLSLSSSLSLSRSLNPLSLSLSHFFFLYVFPSVCLSFCLSVSLTYLFSLLNLSFPFIVPYTQILSVRPYLFFEPSGHGREQQIISNAQRNVPGQLCYSLIPNR